MDPECKMETVKRVASVLGSLLTSCSCGRARTRAWSEAAPDTPEEFPAPPACPGGADAAYSAEKTHIASSLTSFPFIFKVRVHEDMQQIWHDCNDFLKKNTFSCKKTRQP